MAKTSAETAIELRGKFEFYLLALTFSILGLSIQTAGFGVCLSADAFELVGWLALFVSGVIGILRAELIPVAYDIQSKITHTRRQHDEVATALQQGNQIPFSFVEAGIVSVLHGTQAIAKLDNTIVTLEAKFKATEDKIIRRYNRMKWFFMIGIGCLLVARGLPPTISIVERLAVI